MMSSRLIENAGGLSQQECRCWNVAGALVRPNNMTLNLKWPWRVEKCGFSLFCLPSALLVSIHLPNQVS